MKRKILCMLAMAMMCCGILKAQEVLLPFGQFTLVPWTGSFFFALNDADSPADNWYAVDFDDSNWGTIEGPISTSGGISYYATLWKSNYATYWVRRHFNAEDIDEYSIINLYIRHDDKCVIYLNGKMIYDSTTISYTNLITVAMTDEMRSAMVEGDNVLAIKVIDGGGQAFMDVGITAYTAQPLINPDFNDNLNGWTLSGNGILRGGQSFNYVARSLDANPFDVYQSINGKRGLYKLRAQAFEGVEDHSKGYTTYQNDKSTKSYIYVGDNHHMVKNVFDEALKDNIYSGISSGYYETSDGTFIPQLMTAASIAYHAGMYQNEMYAYIDTTFFKIGIGREETTEQSRWTVFDNFRLDYISEKGLDKLINKMKVLTTLPMEKCFLDALNALCVKLNAANDYEAKSRLLSAQGDDYVNARISNERYTLVVDAANALQSRLDTGAMMSPSVVAEAKAFLAQIRSEIVAGTLPSDMAKDIVAQLNEYNKRLNYIYIDVNISVPGSLGDSILAHVENFVDVRSLKISGTLDNSDIITIKNRLTQLREIDLTNLNMTELPKNLFYQRKMIELFKLPQKLESIGDYAFYQCYSMKHIDFPATLTSISSNAFSECDSLLEVILPEGLTTLGSSAFYSCDNIKYIKLPSTLSSISTSTFSYNIRLKAIDFSEGLTHIYDDAFIQCHALNNLRFPKSLNYIGYRAFQENSSLSDLELNEGLFQIRDNAFSNCDALTEVTLPSSLVLAHESPFDYCDNLRKVTCLSIEPPYIKDQIPYGLTMDGRELYVPALSINAYKQTAGWDKFPTIKPIEYLPENIAVRSDFHLTLPESIPAGYKPNVELIHTLDPDHQYGCLTANGVGTLSMSNYKMTYDPNLRYNNSSLIYCSLVNNSHLRADQVTIDVNLPNDRWSFLTMPFDVSMANIETFYEGSTNWVVRKYDGQKRADGETTETWVKLGSDAVLKAGEGYIIQSSRYIGTNRQDYSGIRMHAINNTNKNNIFSTTDVTVTLNEYESEFAHNRSWNLIGNPYPCYYDTRFMDFEAPITVWNMRNNTYEAYSPSDDSYILCPGEAFFVQRPISSGNIVFNKDGRQTNRDVRAIDASARAKVRKVSAAKAPRTIVNVSLSDGNNTDRTRIVLNSNATKQYEMDKDACKFMSSDATVPQIYTSAENVNYSINERPFDDGTVNLSVYIGTGGLFTIALVSDIEGYDILLEDKALNKMVVLNGESSYAFSAEAGTYANRFVLHFDNESTGIENVPADIKEDASVYSIEGVRITTPTKNGIYIQNGKKIMLNK